MSHVITTRTQDEVDELMNLVSDVIDDEGTRFSGMTYEQGVQATIDWLLGNTDVNPMAEEDD